MDELEQSWLATREMAMEVKRGGGNITPALEALRDAKTMLNECRHRTDSRSMLLGKAHALIGDAQKDLFLEAEPLGDYFAKKWEEELKEVMHGKKFGDFQLQEATFYPGMPRDGGWVRISLDIPEDILSEVARRHALNFETEEGVILLKGDKDRVKEALADLAGYVKG